MLIAVCDDEAICREHIVKYLNEYKSNIVYSISEFCSGSALLNAMKAGHAFDLIFLDIEMPGMSGIEASQEIYEINNNTMFIFITAHHQYYHHAFDVNAIQYIVKPIDRDLLEKSFKRAMDIYQRRIYKHMIHGKDGTSFLTVQDILYISTNGSRHLEAVTEHGNYDYIGKISDEEKILLNYDFLRCHNAFLINMNYIKTFTKESFILLNGNEIPISKHIRSHVLQTFHNFIKRTCNVT